MFGLSHISISCVRRRSWLLRFAVDDWTPSSRFSRWAGVTHWSVMSCWNIHCVDWYSAETFITWDIPPDTTPSWIGSRLRVTGIASFPIFLKGVPVERVISRRGVVSWIPLVRHWNVTNSSGNCGSESRNTIEVKWIYIAHSRETSEALRHWSHSVTCNYTDPCLYLVSIYTSIHVTFIVLCCIVLALAIHSAYFIKRFSLLTAMMSNKLLGLDLDQMAPHQTGVANI